MRVVWFSLMGLIAIYGLPDALYRCFDLNQCLARQHTPAMMMWMVTRLACHGFAQKLFVAARVAMGFFAVLGVGFFDNIKKGQGAFEKTTPCKV